MWNIIIIYSFSFSNIVTYVHCIYLQEEVSLDWISHLFQVKKLTLI